MRFSTGDRSGQAMRAVVLVQDRRLITRAEMREALRIGQDCATSYLREMELNGWVRKGQKIGPNGRWVAQWEWVK